MKNARRMGLYLLGCLLVAVGYTSLPELGTKAAELPSLATRDAEGWDVSLDLSALEDLPYSCFQRDALVVRARDPLPERVRWAFLPGAPGELYVGKLGLELGDAGRVDLPPVMRGHDGVFRSTQVHVEVGEDTPDTTSRADATMVLRTEGDRLDGTLHLQSLHGCRDAACTEADVRCAVSVGIAGKRVGAELLATVY